MRVLQNEIVLQHPFCGFRKIVQNEQTEAEGVRRSETEPLMPYDGQFLPFSACHPRKAVALRRLPHLK